MLPALVTVPTPLARTPTVPPSITPVAWLVTLPPEQRQTASKPCPVIVPALVTGLVPLTPW